MSIVESPKSMLFVTTAQEYQTTTFGAHTLPSAHTRHNKTKPRKARSFLELRWKK
jgi:hypothetical protein